MKPDFDNPILIGNFAVDSGQAMVGDPAYLKEWQLWDSDTEAFDVSDKRIGQYSYLGSCATTLNAEYGELEFGKAVVFNTGFGDGLYPVYAILDTETGKVAQVIIDFAEDQD